MSGRVKFEINNINCGYHLEKLRAKGVKIVNIVQQEKVVRLETRARQAQTVKKYFEMCAVEYKILSDGRARQKIKNISRHATLIVGGMMALGVITFLSNFCFSIEVKCEDKDIAKQVEYALKQDKVVGKLKWSVDSKVLEKKIVDSVDNIAFAQVYFVGSVAKVDVVCQKVELAPSQGWDKIVASEDAVISRVLCFSGTPLVKAGDSVKKGQTLIDGYVEVGNKDSENYQKIAVKAKGEIFARVWRSERLNIAERTIAFVRTGQKQYLTEVVAFGKTFKPSKTIEFGYYEVEKKSTLVGAVAPLRVNICTVWELVEKDIIADEAYIESKIFEAKSKIVARLKQEEKICLNWKIVKRLDNMVQIDIYYEVEKLVALGMP